MIFGWLRAAPDWQTNILTKDVLDGMVQDLQTPLPLTPYQQTIAKEAFGADVFLPLGGYATRSNGLTVSESISGTNDQATAMLLVRKSFKSGLDITCPPHLVSHFILTALAHDAVDYKTDDKTKDVFGSSPIDPHFFEEEYGAMTEHYAKNVDNYLAVRIIGHGFGVYINALEKHLSPLLPSNRLKSLLIEQDSLTSRDHLTLWLLLGLNAPLAVQGETVPTEQSVRAGFSLAKQRNIFKSRFTIFPRKDSPEPAHALCPAQHMLGEVLASIYPTIVETMKANPKFDNLRQKAQADIRSQKTSNDGKPAPGCPFHELKRI